ncbi:MAG: hypothetical protein ABIU05_06280 [Nitrospirales bacterium]
MTTHIDDMLSRLEGVRPRGTGKWSARCPAHQDDNPSLSITEGDKGLLLRCWAGCELIAITGKLGLAVKDLFYDSLPDPRQRWQALQRRANERAAQQAADRARGRKSDLLKHAEYLVQSARGMDISAWSPAQLDKRLNILAHAYAALEGECYEQS